MRRLAFLVIFLAFSSASSASAQTLLAILKRMEQHQNALKSLRAEMTIDKFSAETGGVFTKESTLTILPKKNGNHPVRIDSTKPETHNFLIVENKFLIYFPNRKLAYTGTATDSQKLPLLMFSDTAQLKAGYSIVYKGSEKIDGTTSVLYLELTPKTPQSYDKIELWVDTNGMPIRMRVNEANGDWTGVRLSNLRKNVTINASEFRINLPKGTKIVNE